jgi:hypothetical protein
MWTDVIYKALGFLPNYIKHTPLYKKCFSKGAAKVGHFLLGPRIQIYSLPVAEFGFSHDIFQVLEVGISNIPDVKFLSRLDWVLLRKMEQLANSLISCRPLDNGMISVCFMNSEREQIPEPKRFKTCNWLQLKSQGSSKIGVAGLYKSGACYGSLTGIGERWLMGNHGIDIPLEPGKYYVQVSVQDCETGITYATSCFELTHQGSPESFRLMDIQFKSLF